MSAEQKNEIWKMWREGETLRAIARMLEHQPGSAYRAANRTSGIARLPARSADGLGQHLHCHADGAALALCDAGQGGAQGHGKRGVRADKPGQQTAGKTTSVVTWDRGTEMASHRNFSIATDVQVYFCDPHSPRQRVSNENKNGLLRRPASDLTIYEPAEKLAETLGVASTG
jgi:hypothetical protein